MGAEGSTSGGFWGGGFGSRSRKHGEYVTDRALAGGQLTDVFQQLEALFMPYEDLVATGRIKPGAGEGTASIGRPQSGGLRDSIDSQERLGQQQAALAADSAFANQFAGLGPRESRGSRLLDAYQDSLSASDPAYGAMRREMATSLNFDENGLPADVTRGILQGVRGSSSARGLLDSGTAGLEEVAALMGGRENLRASRIAQVNQYLAGPMQSAISQLFPGASTIYQGELQRALGRAGIYANVQQNANQLSTGTQQSLGITY